MVDPSFTWGADPFKAIEHAEVLEYVARVDAGTIELVRSLGVEVVSSADLVQVFEARWGEAGRASHERAARHLGEVATLAHGWVRDLLRADGIAEKVGGLDRLATLDHLLGKVSHLK